MPRKQLGAELRVLRERKGVTLDDIAKELIISTSKLSRLENAQGRPQARDVRDLIRYFDIENTDQADRFMRWTRAANKRAWWDDYTEALEGDLDTYLATESEASIVRVYTIPILPVLLQTLEYTRALFKRSEPWRSASDIEQLLEVRSRRRQALESRPELAPLQLIAVAHESCIRQMVGSAEIMCTQLDYLVERSAKENIELRILPFSVTPPRTSTCMYAYFEFDEYDRDIVGVETHAGFRYFETPDQQVARYRRFYDDLHRSSLTPEESVRLIQSVRNDFSAA
ncbi:helix-turn-helix domain-containing protein [Kibdelosporangium philippinense]|uniref:Helix-turn-helix domain-containing protein n=2 Tax=Kibdelosporangium philippinense TaxID=211113 RepID=A0ABS8ZMC0_9PSEU|nr:helix-turn-helix transcriptional regulator [Kibdelosporangium philippinense]MCE7008308.1 helix-turn-helix domain-containing protein [Kibdelosporangium philippinense]